MINLREDAVQKQLVVQSFGTCKNSEYHHVLNDKHNLVICS